MRDKSAIRHDIIEALKTLFDPEIPINIYDLGLIYEVIVSDDKDVYVQMTLTSPNCPVAEVCLWEANEKYFRYLELKASRLILLSTHHGMKINSRMKPNLNLAFCN